jgi:hypothetical protein
MTYTEELYERMITNNRDNPRSLKQAIREAPNLSLALVVEELDRQILYDGGLIIIGKRDKNSLFKINNPLYIGGGDSIDLKLEAEDCHRSLILVGEGRLKLDRTFKIEAYQIQDLDTLERELEKYRLVGNYKQPCRYLGIGGHKKIEPKKVENGLELGRYFLRDN